MKQEKTKYKRKEIIETLSASAYHFPHLIKKSFNWFRPLTLWQMISIEIEGWGGEDKLTGGDYWDIQYFLWIVDKNYWNLWDHTGGNTIEIGRIYVEAKGVFVK